LGPTKDQCTGTGQIILLVVSGKLMVLEGKKIDSLTGIYDKKRQ
jgi:hypothetical protein